MEISESRALGPRDRRPDGLGDFLVLPDELICAILESLSARDVARLSCVSSVMYILCNEEPLWLSLCLNTLSGPLEYKGSWKKTVLHLEHVPYECDEARRKPLNFDGFNSMFLYRRLYRCHTTLDGFSFDNGNVERKNKITVEEFSCDYDGKKPVLLTGLADAWPARHTWTLDHLLQNYGDTAFKISQRSSRKISMTFKDYVSYMKVQHDEDPLYIFDHKFGDFEPVPGIHFLCGRKRWALYPPGRVPIGVTVHVNKEDGDVNIETPTSLQWWLDFYPLLADEDKPIECTQMPGETIFVPSGWWHCVLNLEPSIAVTQNFVNSKNFEFVCLDMAPGYRHKGVCRAGLLADDEGSIEDSTINILYDKDEFNSSDMTRKEKRVRTFKPGEYPSSERTSNGAQGFSYDVNFLAMYLDEERDHYNSPWSAGNCIGQREMREWLFKLWVGKPGIRELVWKGACLALNAGKWSESLSEVCAFHNLPSPTDDERLPVGTGSNPVSYLMSNCAFLTYILYLRARLQLEFYSLLGKVNSPLKNHIPEVLASGIIYLENGTYKIVPWDGNRVPDVIAKCSFIPEKVKGDASPFGVWRKKQFEYRKAGMSTNEAISSAEYTRIWPYLITKRCQGKIYAELRDTVSREDELNLASFLGVQLRNLHLLPYPPLNISTFSDIEQESGLPFTNVSMEDVSIKSNIPAEWDIFIRTLSKKKKDVSSRLIKWGDPIPSTLIEKVDQYIPNDFAKFLYIFKDENGLNKVGKNCSWIHSDIMDDNIHMELCGVNSCLIGNAKNTGLVKNGSLNGDGDNAESKTWCPSHILDFSNLSIGDPIYDLIPLYLDIFRGDCCLLKRFLASYKLPLLRRSSQDEYVEGGDKFGRLSYHAMCYCILHEENVLGAIFSLWDELKIAKSWEEVEQVVWGELNNYKGFPGSYTFLSSSEPTTPTIF
ncbi:hypothetical protein M0R45_027492 [Rubus argutus]|uniref:F-box protein n=1 Tax=Rubus argutus TaxID=59490 RepID=A0AAW1X0J2_RUBAR